MSIEIKQVGEIFITREGRTVEIIDKDFSRPQYPWMALYDDEPDRVDWYSTNGRFSIVCANKLDLVEKVVIRKAFPPVEPQVIDPRSTADLAREADAFAKQPSEMNDRIYDRTAKDKETPCPVVSAPDLLRKAAEIMAERGKTYDSEGGERSMGKAVSAFNTITGRELTESEGWLLLQLLKDVRQWSREGYHADSAEDCIAYAALKAEALAGGA